MGQNQEVRGIFWDIIVNGFKAAGITEALQKANEVVERIENPFKKLTDPFIRVLTLL